MSSKLTGLSWIVRGCLCLKVSDHGPNPSRTTCLIDGVICAPLRRQVSVNFSAVPGWARKSEKSLTPVGPSHCSYSFHRGDTTANGLTNGSRMFSPQERRMEVRGDTGGTFRAHRVDGMMSRVCTCSAWAVLYGSKARLPVGHIAWAAVIGKLIVWGVSWPALQQESDPSREADSMGQFAWGIGTLLCFQ